MPTSLTPFCPPIVGGIEKFLASLQQPAPFPQECHAHLPPVQIPGLTPNHQRGFFRTAIKTDIDNVIAERVLVNEPGAAQSLEHTFTHPGRGKKVNPRMMQYCLVKACGLESSGTARRLGDDSTLASFVDL